MDCHVFGNVAEGDLPAYLFIWVKGPFQPGLVAAIRTAAERQAELGTIECRVKSTDRVILLSCGRRPTLRQLEHAARAIGHHAHLKVRWMDTDTLVGAVSDMVSRAGVLAMLNSPPLLHTTN